MKITINNEEFNFDNPADFNATLNCVGMVKADLKLYVKLYNKEGQMKTFNKFALDNSKILVTLQKNKNLWKRFISWLKTI